MNAFTKHTKKIIPLPRKSKDISKGILITIDTIVITNQRIDTIPI